VRPFYVVAPIAKGMEIDKALLKEATRVLWACGHKWAEVHVVHEADA
jgi:hypothetical protein